MGNHHSGTPLTASVWSKRTFCRSRFRAGSLFRQLWHEPCASLWSERKVTRVKKKAISGYLLPSEMLVRAVGRWLCSAWCIQRGGSERLGSCLVSGILEGGIAKFVSLPVSVGGGNLPGFDTLRWPAGKFLVLHSSGAGSARCGQIPAFISGFVCWGKLWFSSASEIPSLVWCWDVDLILPREWKLAI